MLNESTPSTEALKKQMILMKVMNELRVQLVSTKHTLSAIFHQKKPVNMNIADVLAKM
jgi:hypothetical protein